MTAITETTDGNLKRANPLTQFVSAVSGMTLHPARFYTRLPQEISLSAAIGFAAATSALSAALAVGLGGQEGGLSAMGLVFLNGFSMPFIFSFLLYLVSIPLCREAFTYQQILAVAAYSNVTLLVAWIPGLPYLAGIWKFVLIGLGMVKMGSIGKGRAAVCIAGAISLFLLVIHLFQLVMA